ncbi:hypothetical protein N0V95_009629, partial [Ascochyta clinopodiicola]
VGAVHVLLVADAETLRAQRAVSRDMLLDALESGCRRAYRAFRLASDIDCSGCGRVQSASGAVLEIVE